VQRFKYYISNIILIDSASGKKQCINEYYLIDAFSPVNEIALKVALPQVTDVQFIIGVDSLKKCKRCSNGQPRPVARNVLDVEFGIYYGKA